MSREIKFRAWNGSEMHFDGPLLKVTGNTLMLLDPHIKDDRWIDLKKDCIFMQFTGLHDKNGKEIYEGDIVVKDGYIWFDNGEPNYRGTVEWIFSQWQVVAHCVNKDKRGVSDGINEGINDDGVDDGENTRWIVLGNVHENPELL